MVNNIVNGLLILYREKRDCSAFCIYPLPVLSIDKLNVGISTADHAKRRRLAMGHEAAGSLLRQDCELMQGWGAKSFNFKMGTNALFVSLRKFNLVAQRCIILGGPKQSANVFQDMDRQL